MKKVLPLLMLIFQLSSASFADTLSPKEYGLFQLDYAMKQVEGVDNDMYFFLGWRSDEKEAWKEASEASVKELAEIRAYLESLDLPEELAELRKGAQILIESRKKLYDGIHLKDAETIKSGYADYNQTDEKYGAIFEKQVKESLTFDDLPDGFSVLNAELALANNEEDREVYRRAAQWIENGDYIEAYNDLALLREKYRGTLFEWSILLQLSDCLADGGAQVHEYSAGSPYKGETALDYLSEIMNSGQYSLILDEAFRKWRANYQMWHHGMSNWSDIPNKMYNEKRWEVVGIIKKYIETHPDNVLGKWQIFSIMATPNIVRGGAFGNSNINHHATLYKDLKGGYGD